MRIQIYVNGKYERTFEADIVPREGEQLSFYGNDNNGQTTCTSYHVSGVSYAFPSDRGYGGDPRNVDGVRLLVYADRLK